MDEQQRIAELDAIVTAKDAEIATLMAQVTALTRQVAELAAKLGQNSRNSHLPPSSDPPGSAGKTGSGKPRSKSARKRGGQRGHRGTRREFVPEARVHDFIDFYPAEYENCWAALPRGGRPEREAVSGHRGTSDPAAHVGVSAART